MSDSCKYTSNVERSGEAGGLWGLQSAVSYHDQKEYVRGDPVLDGPRSDQTVRIRLQS
jgi:hypothetical protein